MHAAPGPNSSWQSVSFLQNRQSWAGSSTPVKSPQKPALPVVRWQPQRGFRVARDRRTHRAPTGLRRTGAGVVGNAGGGARIADARAAQRAITLARLPDVEAAKGVERWRRSRRLLLRLFLVLLMVVVLGLNVERAKRPRLEGRGRRRGNVRGRDVTQPCQLIESKYQNDGGPSRAYLPLRGDRTQELTKIMKFRSIRSLNTWNESV